jgi:hypothetical protein
MMVAGVGLLLFGIAKDSKTKSLSLAATWDLLFS